jgi:hypothetical protein
VSSTEASDQLRRLKALVVEAFSQARNDGKPDWDRMTIAVLKNRLLQITDRKFKEQEYGARRFIDLIKSLPELVTVDESAAPPIVELLNKPAPPAREGRLRRDLWQAVMDYSSGTQYVWDPSGEARPRTPDDLEDLPSIPTISSDEMKDLRREFAKEALANPANEAVADRVREWAEKGYKTGYLPQHLRGAWNQRVTDAALGRIRQWFRDRGITEPDKLVLEPSHEAGESAVESTDALRSFILRAVEGMTPGELRRIELPASAAMRAHRKRA